MYIMSYAFMLSLAIPIIVYGLSYFLFMRSYNDRYKSSPFECGFDPYSNARIPFSTRFFLLAIIFIVFDIEVVLLMPTPMLIDYSSNLSFMFIFYILMMILFIGLIHEWNEGSINWIS
uniref:NADH-ubiquinone oxidoreductase chain 3 n=1 Tax=Erpobdella octoculata TaxID=39305 RepID=A0A7D7J5S3_9ANNE|nr:NADH dehydrogenase subunit 3 [Erpobdella octoculata]UZT67809.1 NADH dehydrogenase subunit 3 [Erpobdella octoculata]